MPTIPSSNLVAHYAINEGSGQTAADSSGNSNDCQLGSTAGSDANDPSWTADGGETVLSFTGDNKGLLCPTDTTGPFSMFIALKVDSANRSGQDTWFYGHGGPDQGPFGTNILKMYTEGIGTFSGTNVNITSYYDEWHVYWATFDGTAIHLGIDKTEWESTTWAAIDNTNISVGNTYIFNDGVTGFVGYALIYDSDYTANIDAVIDGIDAAKPGLGILP